MINRRETFRLGGGIATLAALAGTAVLAASCDPIPAPAAEHDPMLDLIRRYRAAMADWNACGLQDDEFDAYGDRVADPLWRELCDNPPVITTKAGAIEALRLASSEISNFSFGGCEGTLVRAALAYFDGSA